jgi:hypothetical protein
LHRKGSSLVWTLCESGCERLPGSAAAFWCQTGASSREHAGSTAASRSGVTSRGVSAQYPGMLCVGDPGRSSPLVGFGSGTAPVDRAEHSPKWRPPIEWVTASAAQPIRRPTGDLAPGPGLLHD